MPDGDVVIYYNLIPTESSIRTAAEKVTESIGRGMGKSTSKMAAEMEKDIQKVIEKNLKGAGILETIFPKKKGSIYADEGEAEGGGKGEGIIARILSSGFAELVGLFSVVAVFYEAVGPILKVVIKALAAILLILLMPVLKLLLPALPNVIKSLIGLAKSASKMEQTLLDILKAIGKFVVDFVTKLLTGDFSGALKMVVDLVIGALAMLVKVLLSGVNLLGTAIFGEKIWSGIKEAIGMVVKFFSTEIWGRVQAGVDFIQGMFDPNLGVWDKIKLAINFIGTEVFGPTVWGAIKDAVSWIKAEVFGGTLWDDIKGAIDYIGTSIFGTKIWESIKDAVDFVSKIFTVKGLWDNIKKAVDFIGESVFGKGIWDDIKKAVDDVKTWLSDFAKAKDNVQIIIDILGWLATPLQHLLDLLMKLPGLGGGSTHGDFISRPGQAVASFSPNDTIIGMKNPGTAGGNVTVNNTFNIDAGVDSSKLKQILSEFSRQQARDLRQRVSYPGGVYS